MPTGTLVDLPVLAPLPISRPVQARPVGGSRHEAGLSRRLVWTVLTAWTVLWGLVHAPAGGYSWHYFALGAKLLTSPAAGAGGVHLYASHPELQIGPLSLLVAAPLRHLDPWQGRVAASVLLTAMGLFVLTAMGLFVLAALVRVREQTDRVANSLLLLIGLLLLPVWCELGTPAGAVMSSPCCCC